MISTNISMEVDGEAFAAFEADELFVLTALGGGALARGQGNDRS
jgi:hypothetical protein